MSEFGWAYISGSKYGQGPIGSVQYKIEGGLNGKDALVFQDSTNTLVLTGALVVNGSITASNYVVNNVSNMYSSGDSKFGDTSNDTHQFTGSLNLLGNLSASQNISASFFYGDGSHLTGLPEPAITSYTNPTDNRILTSVDATAVNAEEFLTFDGSTLSITGDVTASVGLSSSAGQFGLLTAQTAQHTYLTGTYITGTAVTVGSTSISNGQISATGVTGTLNTAAQPNITSVGTLDSLNITGDLTVDTATGRTFAVHSAADNVSIGRDDSAAKKLEIYSSTGQLRLSNTATAWPTVDKKADITLDSAGDLILDPDRDVLVSGSLVVSGTVYAKQLITDIVSKNISIINAVGSTKFGDDSGDTHQFTGSIYGTSLISGSNFQATNIQSLTLSASTHVSASTFYGDGSNLTGLNVAVNTYSNSLDNRIITSTGGTGINGESNLTFNGATNVLSVTGQVTASMGVSSSHVQGTNANFVNIAGTLSTATQNAITSVGNLDSLTVVNDLLVDGGVLKVDTTADGVSIGRNATPNRKLEVHQVHATNPQFRISNKSTGLGTPDVYTDFRVNQSGDLFINPSGLDTFISGNLEVSGTVFAHEFVTDIVNKNVTNISVTGSTKFGDTSDDTHIFTGSMFVSSSITAPSLQTTRLSASTHVSASTYYGDGSNLTGLDVAVNTYGNSSNHRVITSTGGAGIEGESNLTFDGNTLNITGQLTASNYVSASNFYGNSATFNTIGGTLSTATQNAITSVGNLSNLTVSGDLNVSGIAKFDNTSDTISIGRTSTANRKLEVFEFHATNPQLRITNKSAGIGNPDVYTDFQVDQTGKLNIDPSGGEVKVTGLMNLNGDLSAAGGVTFKRVSKSANYTVTNSDYFIGVNAGTALKLTLPAANTCRDGQNFVIKDEAGNASTYNIEISCSSGNTIDGDGSIFLTVDYSAVNVYTDGSSKFFVY